MKTVFDAVGALSRGLAVIAGTILGVMPFLIVYDVTMRNTGWLESPIWAVPASEFGLLYAMALGAPWLVQRRGHVVIELLFMRLPRPVQRILEKAIYVLSITVCLAMAAVALRRALDAFATGETDYRAFAMPAEYLYGPLALGFLLMALEFLRYLVGPDSYYFGDHSDRGTI